MSDRHESSFQTYLEARTNTLSNTEPIFSAIDSGKPIKLIMCELSDHDEELIKETLDYILIKYRCNHLMATLYTCAKELLVNAIKANAKDLWFRQRGLNIHEEEDYLRGTEEYAGQISEGQIRKLAPELTAANMVVEMVFEHEPHGLRFTVNNTTLISPHDEARLRHKMNLATQYDDLPTFFMEHGMDTEGAGIGLALVVILLKGEGLDPSLFRIGIQDRRTSARLEIPLTDGFQSKRVSSETRLN